ncbi:MAG: GatB/YqeY domain-containing protein, partial [Betaproteobacteria bacterium]
SEDMKAAMRAKDSARLGAIRFLLAAIKQREVDERISADDAVVLAVIEKMAKQRRDSIAQFEQAGRHDLADKEKAELALLQTYLPQPLSEDELLAAIRAAIAEAGGSGPQAMGKVMGLLKPRIAGRADPARASAMVRQLLAG